MTDIRLQVVKNGFSVACCRFAAGELACLYCGTVGGLLVVQYTYWWAAGSNMYIV